MALLFAGGLRSAGVEEHDYARETEERCRQAEANWRKAGAPGASTRTGDALVEAAISANRADLAEQVLAGPNLGKRMLRAPPGGQRVRLHVLRTFTEFPAHLADEMFASFSGENRWLARRLTKGNVEVWTSGHGWLFDRKGRLLHEAALRRGTGWGREWYGAFLPDGRWVTTDREAMDGQLAFFSPAGEWLRSLTCEQLAPPPADHGANLLGWGRSDRRGAGWVVNVGSEDGWATVWVGPNGPARVLGDGHKWDLCYPRALGPRGTCWSMRVPDDAGTWGLTRGEAGHGPGVGFPSYSRDLWRSHETGEAVSYTIPGGNYVFGFWPGKSSFFVGAEDYEREKVSDRRTRKFQGDAQPDPVPIIDKTWLFDTTGNLTHWVRARRIGDAADGHAELLRMTADSRIMTLGANLRVRAMRHFTWEDGSTGDAVALWDDLRLGLFIRHDHLVLASWAARR